MNHRPRLLSPDEYDDDVRDEDISYEPLDDVTWVDDEEAIAVEVADDDIAAPPDAPPAPPDGEHAGNAEGRADEPAPAPDPATGSDAPCLFRVVAPLAEDLRAAIAAVRSAHALEGAAPDALELIAPFRSDDPAALGEALRTWAAERLPLELTLSEVAADVLGARRYVAGWALDPAGRLAGAQQALARALSPLIAPCADTPDVFEPRLVVADCVPPPVFPRLIADMQRMFEPQDWTLTHITLEEAHPAERPARWTPHLALP